MKKASKKAEEKLRAALLKAIEKGNKPAQHVLGEELSRIEFPCLWAAFANAVRRK